MNYNLDLLREELCDLHRENEELKDEVKFLEQELQEAQEVLDDIEGILVDELGEKLGTRVYNRIFGLDQNKGSSIKATLFYLRLPTLKLNEVE